MVTTKRNLKKRDTDQRSRDRCFSRALSFVKERSLISHLALASFQSGHGSQHLLYQLIRTTCLSYLMWNEGLGGGNYQLYCDAEREIEAIAAGHASGGPWTLSEKARCILEKIVCIYDSQLGWYIVGALRTMPHKAGAPPQRVGRPIRGHFSTAR